MTRFLLGLSLAFATTSTALADDTVKVFILAGQSNMEGHGKVDAEQKANQGKGSLEWLVNNPGTAKQFKHLVDAKGKWIARDDVQIWYLGRKGNLLPKYGFREGFIGPELGFGHVVGNAIDEPVLLIKLAWGGKSLAKDFRPPSSGGEVGPYYKELLKLTREVLGDAKTLFPQYTDRKLELVGMGWHQGWNDRVNQAFNDAYETNMANFIRDVRKEFKAPDMAFVIGQMGNDGLKADKDGSPRDYIKKAQAAVPEASEFKSNAICVRTDRFWDMEAHAIYTGPGGWSKDVDKWRQFGNDRPYHYYGSPWFFAQAGTGFGEAMIKLLK